MKGTLWLRGSFAAALIVFIVLIALALAGAAPSGASRGAATTDPLTIRRAELPSIGLAYIRTRGAFPQVSGMTGDLAAVNARLRKLVISDEHEFRAAALSNTSLTPAARRSNPGLYRTSVSASLVSASTSVVSVLVQVTLFQPLGAVVEYWLSLTLQVPSASSVSLIDLLARPISGLRAIARVGRQQLLKTNRCVRLSERTAGAMDRLGWLPVAKNYREFALTAKGIAVGFAAGDVAGVPCGALQVRVPYRAVLPYMNGLGRHLVSEVRQATLR